MRHMEMQFVIFLAEYAKKRFLKPQSLLKNINFKSAQSYLDDAQYKIIKITKVAREPLRKIKNKYKEIL